MTNNHLKTLAIIPARGGSKGVPGKNIIKIAGKPLIHWTIEQAIVSKRITRTIVSTDSVEIAEIAKAANADVPFLRPSDLAKDESPTADAVIHALDTLEANGERYDIVALLEPTSPLRRSSDIDRTIDELSKSDLHDSAVTIGEIRTEHPIIAKRIRENRVVPYIEETKKIHQRQQADKSYFPYGVAYASRVDAFRKNRSFYTRMTLPILIESWQNYEIDDEIDFFVVEHLLDRYKDQLIDTE